MKYFKAKWKNSGIDFPFRMIFELDKNNFETRKIEFFENGKFGYAYDDIEFNGTALGIVKTPPIEEINKNPEFEVNKIEKEEFEFIWNILVVK